MKELLLVGCSHGPVHAIDIADMPEYAFVSAIVMVATGIAFIAIGESLMDSSDRSREELKQHDLEKRSEAVEQE